MMGKKMAIQKITQNAQKYLMQYWPLTAFIASNPLWALRDKPFFDVISGQYFKGIMDESYFISLFHSGDITLQNLSHAYEHVFGQNISKKQLTEWMQSTLTTDEVSKVPILLSEQIKEYSYQIPTDFIKEKIFTLLRDFYGLGHYQNQSLIIGKLGFQMIPFINSQLLISHMLTQLLKY